MGKLNIGPIGITLNISSDGTHLNEAAEIERLGYSTIWLPGGQIDSLEQIARIVRATTTIQVASAIISTDVFTSDAVTKFYASSETTAPGRFIVGLGARKNHARCQL